MKGPRRDTLVALALLALLVIVTVLAALQRPVDEETLLPPLASFSARPDGAKALRLWLAELGYGVGDQAGSVYRPPRTAALALVLQPTFSFLPEEAAAMKGWVEDGGTLLLAGDDPATTSLSNRFDWRLVPLSAALDNPAQPQTPLWVAPPPPAIPAPASFRYAWQGPRNDYITHVAVAGRPVVISFQQGQGRVILSASAIPFSNQGLATPGHGELALNAVGMAGRAGDIWFDEWHHGVRSSAPSLAGPGQWLRSTPAGQSILLAAGALFVALLLRGRHFGRPAPPPTATPRRAPLEQLTAAAQLGRRAGHRAAVLRQYRHWLKRDLGRRYRLDPTLPDDEYVAHLQRFDPRLDAPGLRQLLARLDQAQAGEGEMVALAAAAARWLD